MVGVSVGGVAIQTVGVHVSEAVAVGTAVTLAVNVGFGRAVVVREALSTGVEVGLDPRGDTDGRVEGVSQPVTSRATSPINTHPFTLIVAPPSLTSRAVTRSISAAISPSAEAKLEGGDQGVFGHQGDPHQELPNSGLSR